MATAAAAGLACVSASTSGVLHTQHHMHACVRSRHKPSSSFYQSNEEGSADPRALASAVNVRQYTVLINAPGCN